MTATAAAVDLEEAPDVVIDGPAPQHRLDDGREIVVHNHDVRRLLRARANAGSIAAPTTRRRSEVSSFDRASACELLRECALDPSRQSPPTRPPLTEISSLDRSGAAPVRCWDGRKEILARACE